MQGEVENALSRLADTSIACIGAGRTDAGVHASGQVIAWDMDWNHDPLSLLKAINHHLPAAIALKDIRRVDSRFHPRYDAASRTYLYRLYFAPTRDPLRDAFAWQREQPLSSDNVRDALMMLVGVHDFATFGQPTTGDVTIRHLMSASLTEVADEWHIVLSANGFLKRMVRSIVGTVVEVGRKKMSLREFEAAFKAADRRMSGPSAPPRGLVLTEVTYRTGW